MRLIKLLFISVAINQTIFSVVIEDLSWFKKDNITKAIARQFQDPGDSTNKMWQFLYALDQQKNKKGPENRWNYITDVLTFQLLIEALKKDTLLQQAPKQRDQGLFQGFFGALRRTAPGIYTKDDLDKLSAYFYTDFIASMDDQDKDPIAGLLEEKQLTGETPQEVLESYKTLNQEIRNQLKAPAAPAAKPASPAPRAPTPPPSPKSPVAAPSRVPSPVRIATPQRQLPVPPTRSAPSPASAPAILTLAEQKKLDAQKENLSKLRDAIAAKTGVADAVKTVLLGRIDAQLKAIAPINNQLFSQLKADVTNVLQPKTVASAKDKRTAASDVLKKQKEKLQRYMGLVSDVNIEELKDDRDNLLERLGTLFANNQKKQVIKAADFDALDKRVSGFIKRAAAKKQSAPPPLPPKASPAQPTPVKKAPPPLPPKARPIEIVEDVVVQPEDVFRLAESLHILAQYAGAELPAVDEAE